MFHAAADDIEGGGKQYTAVVVLLQCAHAACTTTTTHVGHAANQHARNSRRTEYILAKGYIASWRALTTAHMRSRALVGQTHRTLQGVPRLGGALADALFDGSAAGDDLLLGGTQKLEGSRQSAALGLAVLGCARRMLS